MTATQILVSVGELATRSRRSVLAVLDAAQVLGITPELALDRVPYFTEADAERIERHLAAGGR